MIHSLWIIIYPIKYEPYFTESLEIKMASFEFALSLFWIEIQKKPFYALNYTMTLQRYIRYHTVLFGLSTGHVHFGYFYI